MTKLEAIAFFMDMNECTYGGSEPIQMAIEALRQQDRILQILDDCDLEKIKEVVRVNVTSVS